MKSIAQDTARAQNMLSTANSCSDTWNWLRSSLPLLVHLDDAKLLLLEAVDSEHVDVAVALEYVGYADNTDNL